MAHSPHPTLEKAGAFLKSQALSIASQHTSALASQGPFITISREAGAGASALAKLLAERLHHEVYSSRPWTVFGANLIEAMLQANQLSPTIAQYLPEGRVSEINALVGEIVGLHPSLWGLIQNTNRLTRELACKGGAIFVGRGAVFSTVGVANGVHIRLVAPKKFRATRTADRLKIGSDAAVEYNKRQDASRRAYVKANFNAYGPDPTAYDLVINTAQVPLLEAVQLIASVVHSRTSASSFQGTRVLIETTEGGIHETEEDEYTRISAGNHGAESFRG